MALRLEITMYYATLVHMVKAIQNLQHDQRKLGQNENIIPTVTVVFGN